MKTGMWLISPLIVLSNPVMAQDSTMQCDMIAALTGDYYAQRLSGKTKQDLQQEAPPEFIDSEFFRTIDLAINLAFSVDESMSEDQVETQVYDSCMRHHP